MTGNILMLATGVLVGEELSPLPGLATLPLALQFVATMAATVPASLLMGRVGRRPGFLLGTALGVAGSAIAFAAVWRGSFWLFCLGAMLVGAYNGFGGYYRLAAADTADDAYRSRAISWVLTGGIVAAFAGPSLARWSRELLQAEFAASYLVMAGVALLAAVALSLAPLGRPGPAAPRTGGGRPLGVIVRQPRFFVAALSATLGYAVMVLVMTATPLAMKAHLHSFGQTATVIEWHVLGMFAPSFVTGHLIRRFGIATMLLVGAVLLIGCLAINLLGTDMVHFWSALVLLGIGWNFLFIGGTTLLTETYRPEEKAKTQGANEFLIGAMVAVSSLSAGALQNGLGWQAVNLAMVPLVGLILLAVLWLRWGAPPPAAEAPG